MTDRQSKSVAIWYATSVETVGAKVDVISTGFSGFPGTRVNGSSALWSPSSTESIDRPAPFCIPGVVQCQSVLFFKEEEESL